MRSHLCLILAILQLSLFAAACSIPNLETAQCSEARDVVKEFYSWYLGTDPTQLEQQPEVLDRFISPKFAQSVGGIDPFFLSDTPPTTFKVGRCETVDEDHLRLQVQLYWRYERQIEQKEVFADVVRSDNKWFIEKVEDR